MEIREHILREKIIDTTIAIFTDKGLKLTMDDVAKQLNISKKTLYKIFRDKEELFLAVADEIFSDIKQSEHMLQTRQDLDIVEKIKSIMIVMPERYQNIGLSNLYQLKDKYPSVYARVAEYLESDWDATIALMKQGMAEGKIRPISIPIVKLMVESTIQHFFSSDVLIENGMTYEQGLQEMLDVILQGITEGE